MRGQAFAQTAFHCNHLGADQQEITDHSLTYHLTTARKNGVIRTEMVESLTHVAFYAGWPSAWAVFGQAKEFYVDDCGKEEHGGFFG